MIQQNKTGRKEIIKNIAEVITVIKLDHPVKVAVDGPGNAGKTTFANELAESIIKLNRKVIRSTIDGFHHPPEFRRRQGQFSPKGYLEDSHDYDSLIRNLLEPLSYNGNLEYKESTYNFKINEATNADTKKADKDSILIFDGIFLFKDELLPYWDFKIYIEASFENTMRRAIQRDSDLFGGKDKVIELYKKRYIPGHEMYLSIYNPIEISDFAFNNDNFQNPIVLKFSTNNLS